MSNQTNKPNLVHTLWQENKGFIAFIVIMVLMRSSLGDWNSVPSGSMRPNIIEGDRIWVNKLAYNLHLPFSKVSMQHFGDPQRNDIIVFDSEVSGKRLVKRAVAIPGDIIEIRNKSLYINHKIAQYSAVDQSFQDAANRTSKMTVKYRNEAISGSSHPIQTAGNIDSRRLSFGPKPIPEGYYFAMGDNRDNSHDSRYIGLIPRQEIVGKATTVVLSINYKNWYLPRLDRFFVDLP